MNAIGTGYDLSTSQYAPNGRLYQVIYAQKTAEKSGTVIGLKGTDGVVLAVEKLVNSPLYEPASNRRIFPVDCHISVAAAGLLADSRAIVEVACQEARAYRFDFEKPNYICPLNYYNIDGDAPRETAIHSINYGTAIPLNDLKNRIAMYMHTYTRISALRPFGCSLMLAACDATDGPQLYTIDPSGASWGYKGCALGRHKKAATAELEKLALGQVSARELVKEAARIIYSVHDSDKDGVFELEMSWIGIETGGLHQLVPKSLFESAVFSAQESVKHLNDADEMSTS